MNDAALFYRLRPRTAIVRCLLLLLGCAVGLQAEKREWTMTGGQTSEAELSNRYGDFLHFTAGRGYKVLNIQDLVPADREVALGLMPNLVPPKVDWGSSVSYMAKAIRGRVFAMGEGGEPEPYSLEGRQEPALYALYFSAQWCGPCKRFSPRLIAQYNVWKEMAFESFELFFVSSDRSKREQLEYMRDYNMPFPAVHLGRVGKFSKFKGTGIPCLVLVDREGKVVAHSYVGDNYVGPSSVLETMENLVPASDPYNYAFLQGEIPRFIRLMLRRGGERSSAPGPLFVDCSSFWSDWETLRATKVTLVVDSAGTVSEVRLPAEMSEEHQTVLRAAIAKWLFIPKLEDSKATASQINASLEELFGLAYRRLPEG